MEKTIGLLVLAYFIFGGSKSEASTTSSGSPKPGGNVDNTGRDINNAFNVADKGIDLIRDLLNSKSGSTSVKNWPPDSGTV